MGLRNSEPMKGVWFTPGGRILKNEAWGDCAKRVAYSELGLEIHELGQLRLMGVWDHFYSNSVVSEDISTHYVNLPHVMFVDQRPDLKLDSQHSKIGWFHIEKVANNNNFHQYIRNYALNLLEIGLTL